MIDKLHVEVKNSGKSENSLPQMAIDEAVKVITEKMRITNVSGNPVRYKRECRFSTEGRRGKEIVSNVKKKTQTM